MGEPGTSTWKGGLPGGVSPKSRKRRGDFRPAPTCRSSTMRLRPGKSCAILDFPGNRIDCPAEPALENNASRRLCPPGGKRVVGLAPKDVFFAPILGVAERGNVAALPGEGMVLGRMVETGESRTPRPKGPLTRYTTSLSDALSLAAQGLPPTKSPRGQPISLRQPLLASGLPHPGLMAPASLPPGIVESRR